MKLSAAMICRDCDDTLEACLQSVRPHVDELCIVDTGSHDSTPEIAKRYADKFEVFLGANNIESGLIDDFSLARNRSFDLITGDHVLWIDSDDILVGGENIRKVFEHATQDNVIAMLPYEYSHDAQGRCTCVHWRERIVKPAHRFRWESPIHEVLVPIQPIEGTITTVRTDIVRVVHRHQFRTKPKEQGRNLRILKNHIKKVGESDVRAWYYWGLELGYVGDFGGAIRALRRYVQLSQWYDEKCLAMIELARLYSLIGDYELAIEWSLQASTVRCWPEPYWRLGRVYYAMARAEQDMEYNYRRAATFIKMGLSVGENDTVLFVDPQEKYRIHEFLNVCLSTLGDLDGAIASCEAGLAGLPDYEPLRANREIYLQHRDRKLAKEAIARLALPDAQKNAIEAIIDGRQVELTDKPAPTLETPPLLLEENRKPEPGKLDLVVFLGPGLEPWNPETVARTGIGGSETMAMNMAKLLAAKGHAVRLYGHCTASMEGMFDGVLYLDSSKYRGVNCDVMIASRRPDAVDDQFELTAKARVLWIHDVHVGHNLNFQRDIRFDRILALSQWHKGLLTRVYPLLKPEKVIVTRNGIDLSRFDGTEERDPHRAIYSSSPDRGLPALLDMWPEIQKQVPDATLHVYYGFSNWMTTARMMNDEEALRRAAHLQHLAQTMPGVVFHDRVNQQELAREFMRSGVWCYPTWFSETSCCHPDTRISVPGDHRDGPPTIRIADMVGQSGFPVYAFNEAENRFQLATCKRVWETKIADELVAIELDSGETLRLTPEHLVLSFDGDWVQAGSLRAGDSLRALHYRYNVAIRDANGRWTDEHRLVGEWKEGRRLRRDEHVDHADPQRLDNRPGALSVLVAAQHFSKTHKGKRLSRKHVEKKTVAAMAAVAAMSPERKFAWHSAGGNAAWAKVRAMGDMERAEWFRQRAAKRKETIALRMADPAYAAATLERHRAAGRKGLESRWGKNHRVLSVTRISGPISVYDMEIEGLHNFVADGVVVHNCITAMEAQAAGCRIVTSNLAGLRETVADRGLLLEWDRDWQETNNTEPTAEYRRRFIAAVVYAMNLQEAWAFGTQAPRDNGITRDELKAYAREHFGLYELANEWDVTLTELAAEMTEKVMPEFRDVEVAA